MLRTLPVNSVNCCVTSPPYYGLRDYGVEGQIGLEEHPGEYVARLVDVFREVRRVLRDDGTLWLNLGDSYAANRSYQVSSTKGGPKHGPGQSVGGAGSVVPGGLKGKDLIGIPWRVALALQADGWYLRQDIIWHKPNPMPESVKDRCTKAHEYVFLLSKSARYFYDHEASMEPVAASTVERLSQPTLHQQEGSTRVPGKTNGNMKAAGRTDMRNRRSVWTIATQPYSGAHFATYPPALIEPCILAGCPVGGTVLDPFGGSGTTGAVSISLGRKAVLIELNDQYLDLAIERVEKSAMSATDSAKKRESILTLPGFAAPRPQQGALE